mmetsp:Transcript_52318/g.122915  ORF Transcript_52318/g.122915 Transcript_52318/m.122915 type:complete len:118 (+) Transcript_52318:95-448(+)
MLPPFVYHRVSIFKYRMGAEMMWRAIQHPPACSPRSSTYQGIQVAKATDMDMATAMATGAPMVAVIITMRPTATTAVTTIMQATSTKKAAGVRRSGRMGTISTGDPLPVARSPTFGT